MSRRFLTALVVCVALAVGTARVAAQSVFEPALDTWTLDDTKGKVSLKQKCGVDGQRPCILIEGAKGVDTYALSPQIPDAMRDGLTFHLSAVVKTTSKMYLEIDGVSFDFDPTSTSSALATNRTDLPDGWAEISAFVRLREDTKRKIIIGVNNRDGTCYVDRVALARVTAIRVAEDTRYPALAKDEAVYENGTFASTIFADRHYTAVNPHITVMSAKWDTSRATFTKGRNVTFDYTAATAALKEPLTLEIDVSYVSRTTAYLALLESSDAGKTWTEVGTFGSEVKIYTLALSSVAHSMFCVKIASSEGTIYVKKIRVTSTVKTKPSAAVYGKQVFQIAHEENGVALRIAEKLDAKGEFGITLTNTGNATVDRFKIGYNRVMIAGPSVSSDVAEGSIAKGESLSTVGKVRFSSSNNNIVYYSVGSSDGTVTYASGRFVTAKTHFFDDENFGNYIAEDSAHGTLWWCGSTYKVSKRRAAPEQATKKSAIDVYAAKNEFEAFQLVLKASSSEQTISDVSVTTLTSVDDKSVVIDDISVRRVMYVKTEHPTDEDYGREGEYWPDPLLPLDLPYKCPAGENCPFWVLVHVPFGAKEGSYKGTVSLTASGKKMSSDVTLTVWNFTIPKKQRMRSLFGVEYTYIEAYHHLEDANSTFQKAVYDKYLTSLSKHRISPLYGYPFYWPSTKYVDGKLEYNRFDRHIERLKYLNSEDGFGFASNTIKLFGIKEDIGEHKRGSAKHKELFRESTKHFYNLLKESGLLDEMYVYWFDEPEEENYDEVIEWNDEIKKSAPDLKILLTEQVEDKLKGHVDAWCPVFSNYVKDDIVARQKLGEEAWTYVCCCPKGKRITLFIDHPATELRLWNWHSFKNSVNGVLLWEMAYWSRNFTMKQDPYVDTMSWGREKNNMWGNGDGRFFYPPLEWKTKPNEPLGDDPIETVRLEHLRDGMEDWEYFTTLKEIAASKDATSEQKKVAKKLLDIPNYIVNAKDTEYAVTPEDFLYRRDEVGKFINSYFCGEEYSYSFPLPESEEDSDTNASSLIRPLSFLASVVLLLIISIFRY